MRTEQLRPLGTAALVALVTACLWHVAANGVVAFLVSSGLVVLGWFLKQQRDVERLSRRTPRRRIFGVQVHVVGGAVACTAGPIVPRIFVGTGLITSLDEDELRAVLLHEQAHRVRLDPLRAGIAAAARWVTPSRLHRPEVASHIEALREIRADRDALRRGASRSALAASLLKVPSAPRGTVGFGSVSEARVRALVEGVVPSPCRRLWPVTAVGTVIGAAFCIMELEATLLSSVAACCV